MPTTTNYGWTTPADTDLVKDGASAIRTLGTAIDTTVFNNASAAIAKTIVDAKGDIIAATAADTVARLAVGTNGQYLAANSSTATGLEWQTVAAGSLTLLSTTSLSGTSTTVSSISQSYKHLFIEVRDLYLSVDDEAIRLQFEADGGKHNFGRFGSATGAFNGGNAYDAGYMEIGRAGTPTDVKSKFQGAITIINYTATSTKFIIADSWARTNSNNQYGQSSRGSYTGTTAIDEIKISGEGATLNGGTMLIYGVN